MKLNSLGLMTSLPTGSAGAWRQSSSPFLSKNHPDVETNEGGGNKREEGKRTECTLESSSVVYVKLNKGSRGFQNGFNAAAADNKGSQSRIRIDLLE